MENFQIIIVDEAHCMITSQYQELLARNPSACIIGLSATPFRLKSEEKLSTVFKKLVKGPSVATVRSSVYRFVLMFDYI